MSTLRTIYRLASLAPQLQLSQEKRPAKRGPLFGGHGVSQRRMSEPGWKVDTGYSSSKSPLPEGAAGINGI